MPTFALLGVPDSRPVVVLNTSQLGLFWIENVSVSPSASAVVALEVVRHTHDRAGGSACR